MPTTYRNGFWSPPASEDYRHWDGSSPLLPVPTPDTVRSVLRMLLEAEVGRDGDPDPDPGRDRAGEGEPPQSPLRTVLRTFWDWHTAENQEGDD